MTKIHPINYLKCLDGVREEKTFFLAPAYLDFSNTCNNNCIRLVNALVGNFNSKKIKDIVGSSTSAVIALLLGLGYTVNELRCKLNNVSLNNLTNNKYSTPLSIIVEDKQQNLKFGLRKKEFKCIKEDNFLIWAKQQVADRIGQPLATFADLHNQIQTNTSLRDIHLIGLNLTTQNLVLLNYKNTPDMPIAIALRICMSFSTAFSIVEIVDLSTNKTFTYTDGGITLQHIKVKKCKKVA